MEETKRSGMSKDQFWNLIEKAKEVCGTDLDASAVWIKQQLFYMRLACRRSQMSWGSF